MTKTVVSIAVFLFSLNLGAFELPEESLGDYKIIIGQKSDYLQCEPGELASITNHIKHSFSIHGIVTGSPLEFDNINEGIQGYPQELIGYGERRTFAEVNHFDFSITSENRSCSGLLGSTLGCFSQEWRQTKKIRFFKKTINGTQESYARLDYQPFYDYPMEYCMLKKVAD